MLRGVSNKYKQMCRWYEWEGRPRCKCPNHTTKNGNKATIKCHSAHPTCVDYSDFTEGYLSSPDKLLPGYTDK